MKKPAAATIQSGTRSQLFDAWNISWVMMLLILGVVLVFGELKTWPWKMPALVSCLMLSWMVYSQVTVTVQTRLKPLWRWLTIVTVLVVLAYVGLRFVNVYGLPADPKIQQLCVAQPQVCGTAVRLFFASKLYRFITLSPGFFLSWLLVVAGFGVIGNYRRQVDQQIDRFRREPLEALVVLGIAGILLNQAFFTSNLGFELLLKTWQNRQLSFVDRFVPYEFGIEHHGYIWEYAKFVQAHVPEEARVFIPPQSDIWPQEGNKYYFRWFVYPRDLLQSTDPTAPIPPEATHVLISRGGWVGGAAGWPKLPVKPECIAEVSLIHRRTLVQQTVDPQLLNTTITPESWGVITLKTGATACQ